ncbi:MAG: ribbon-helix-helix domain-containing protein [Alphaproteobacteria bacterium]|nr:ribbon-helix-helix domain-containing protein [Alphaproteobacteria bacterium]
MYQDLKEALLQKRSVSLLGHKTSVALESPFWNVLEEAAKDQGVSLSQLIRDIDGGRKGSLSSALRLYALKYVQENNLLLRT